MSVKLRQELERRILSKFVDDALAAHKRLSVSLERGYDWEDGMLLGSIDRNKIIEEAMAGDDCHVFVHEENGPLTTEDKMLVSEGWVYFVWGNDGYDCISDNTTNLEYLLKGAEAIANQYA
jgi:hypothetical protein